MKTEGEGIRIGELVRAEAGRDRGGYFLVVGRKEGYLWLCDGKRRRVNQPKRKKEKHTTGTGLVCRWMEGQPERINNASVRRELKAMLQKRGGE